MTYWQENFHSFCHSTSLHGWQNILESARSSRLIQYFWASIVCLAMMTAGFFLYTNTWDFINSNVVTTVDTMTAPLSEVYFPSVVVCNINQVRESYFEEVVSMLDHNAISNVTLDVPLNGTHQQCKDMFIYSIWNGTTTYHFAVDRDFGTDYGICCWYTPQFNFTYILENSRQQGQSEPDWGYWFTNIEKGAKTGKDNGYTILLDVESFDYNFFKESSEGLKVALVHHLDMPIMSQRGFHISPGTENQIAITPTLLATTENAMNRFSPEQRDCYSESEIELKYLPGAHGYRYEMTNCLFEATFEHILEQCKCFPNFHSTNDPKVGNYSACVGPELTCVNELMNRLGQIDHVDYNGKSVKCRSNCEDQINSLFVTSSAYPNKVVFTMRKEFCLVIIRLIVKCKTFKRGPLTRVYPELCDLLDNVAEVLQRQIIQDPTILDKECPFEDWNTFRRDLPSCDANACQLEDLIWKYARKNLAILNIFIKDPYAMKFMKDIKQTRTSWFAKSGGIMGLCMGFSLISAAEILYHCFLGVFRGAAAAKARGSGRTRSNRDAITECADLDLWLHPTLTADKEKEGNNSDDSDSGQDFTEDDDEDEVGEIHECQCQNHQVSYCGTLFQSVHICDQRLHFPPLPQAPTLTYRRVCSSQNSVYVFRGPERII